MEFRFICLTGGVLFLLHLLRLRYSRGLNKFNGPFLASFTDLWKVWYAWHNSLTANDIYFDIHQKYGDIVRIGPNNLSFADPQAISDIYGTKGSQQKSKFYEITSPPVRGREKPSILSSTDTRWHDQQRRMINSAFSLSSLLKYEGWVDDSINVFKTQMNQRFVGKPGRDGILDLHKWLSFFTADVISNLTYGKPTGFMEAGTDIDGINEKVQVLLQAWLYFTRMPILDKLTFRNPLLLWLQRRGKLILENPLAKIIHGRFVDRKRIWEAQKSQSSSRETLVDRFLRAEEENSGKSDADLDGFAEKMSFGMVLAGSETTAITLSSVLYFLLKHPACYQKLQQEIDGVPQSHISNEAGNSVFSWTAAQTLTYLDACILEASRLLPVQRMPHDRVVPKGGLVICGQYIPENTDVGIYAPVIHRRAEVFGDGFEMYRPERWLEDPVKRQCMEDAMFTFSYGKYNCLGKNISRMEMYKFLPSVLRQFEFNLVDPAADWKLLNGAFCIPTEVYVRVNNRET